MRRSPRRRRRWLLVIGIAVVLLSGAAFGYLRLKVNGAELGDKIASVLNKRMRGRIEVGSVEWPTSALETVIKGGWVPVVIRDVRLWDDCVLSADVSKVDQDDLHLGDPNEDCTPDDKPDPDATSKRKPRKLLLALPLLTADVDIHALMFGHHDFVFRNVWVHGGEALLEQTREPYPLHAYNRTIVSILSAFYPRMKPGFRAGIYADAPPPIFDLRDIHIEHLNLTVHMGPYTNKDGSIGFSMTARVTDVNADANPAKPDESNYLHMDATDPLVAKFYVRLALRGEHGRLRIFDDGPRTSFHIPHDETDVWAKGRDAKYDIELADIELRRLAQMPTDWARHNYVANSLELDLSAHTIPCGPSQSAGTSGAADLHVSGELDNYWDTPYGGNWNLGLDIANLGPTLRTCIKSKMGGDNLGGRLTLTGPFIALPKVSFDLHGLDFDVPLRKQTEPVRLTLAEVHGDIDLVNDQGSIEKTTALIRNGKEPGEVLVSATFGIKPYNGKASVDIVKPIDVGRFLPDPIPTSVGRFLAGKLTASGDVDFGFALEDFDLTLGPLPGDKLVRVHRGRIFTDDDFDTVKIQKVAVQAGKSYGTFDGKVDTIHPDNTDITISDPHFPDLDVWLGRFGLPKYAASAGGGGQIVIHGPLTSPTVSVQLPFKGVPCMGDLNLDVSIQNNVATIRHVTSAGLGGKLDGNGVVTLSTPKVIEKFHLEGRKLDASKLCGLAPGLLKGTVDTIDLDVKRTTVALNRPPLDWLPSFVVHAKAEHLTVDRDPYSNVALCINHPDDDKLCRGTPQQSRLGPSDIAKCNDAKLRGGACVVAGARRDGGGTIAATAIDSPSGRSGRATFPRKLAGTIAVDDLPLSVLDDAIGAKDVIGGLFSATLHLSSVDGKPTSPLADGNLYLTHSWLTQALIGDSQLQVDPLMVGRMPSLFVHGNALAGQLAVSATVGTEAPYPVDVSITGRRIEVDQFLDLAKKLGVGEPIQAWASGTITMHTELAPLDHKPRELEGWVEVTELEGILDHRSREGRATPLRFKLKPAAADHYAMSLRLTRSTIELACRDATAPTGRKPCPAQLETPAGVLTIEGNATQAQMNLHAIGRLDLRRLGPLLEAQLDDIDGSLDLDAIVKGTFDAPTYAVELAVHDRVHVVPNGVDTALEIQRGGRLRLADGTLGITELTVAVQDTHAAERGELHIKGSIGLANLRPATWNVQIDGQLAGKMLLALAPSSISQASGLARIDQTLTLTGHGALPEVAGSISFDPTSGQPFSLRPRGAPKQVELLGGRIEISTVAAGDHRDYTLRVSDHPVTASLDGEGKLQNIVGEVVLTDGTPSSARVSLDAENIPFRQPGTLDLIVSAKAISLELPAGAPAWRVRGDVSIVSGRYVRNFELAEAIKREPPPAAPARPLWDEYPSIGNADLALTLEVRKFAVDDNIASIDLEGPHILITGSPRDLRLSGSIRVQRGEFKIPGTRAKFTRTSGSIDFAENDRAGNPKLEITSEADFLDLNGQLHIIKLTITGPLDRRQWDLTTSTGYDKSQTLGLLFLGRNPEQLRRSLGDQSLGTNPTQVEVTTNPSSTFADQIVKDLAGQYVSDLLGDSLTKITGLDVLRFEVGFGAVGFHAEKKLVESIKFTGDGEQTVRGTTINGTGEVKAPWQLGPEGRLSFQSVYLRKNYSDPAEQDQDYQDIQFKFVYRLFIP